MYDSVELEIGNIFPIKVAQVKAKALKHWVRCVFFILKKKIDCKKGIYWHHYKKGQKLQN